MKKYKVGIIGCGSISKNYARFAREVYSDFFTIVACSDLDLAKAETLAKDFEIEKFGLPEIVYGDPEIDIILNLTIPMAHEEVTIRALEAGKHVYTEKPLACSREGMDRILATAERCNKRVGSAPDTFMSAPSQTAKKVIEDGWIGKPIGINAICPERGNEFWRPDADFFYKKGAGPMMDMAAYYLNQFVNIVGPVESVQTMSKITWPERTIKVAPRRGEKIQVEVPTYANSLIKFKSGVLASFTNVFDIWATKQPYIEIYGEIGTIVLPNPNRFVGEVLIKRLKDTEWRSVPQFNEYFAYGRGIGIVDMIKSIEAGVPHRASAEFAYHTTDVIFAMEQAGEAGKELLVNSTVSKPDGLWNSPDTILWK